MEPNGKKNPMVKEFPKEIITKIKIQNYLFVVHLFLDEFPS